MKWADEEHSAQSPTFCRKRGPDVLGEQGGASGDGGNEPSLKQLKTLLKVFLSKIKWALCHMEGTTKSSKVGKYCAEKRGGTFVRRWGDSNRQKRRESSRPSKPGEVDTAVRGGRA